MNKLTNNVRNLLALTLLGTTLVACHSGGGSSTSTSTSSGSYYSSPSFYDSPNITASTFVNALNQTDATGYYDNELMKDIYETERPGDWFVIWDEKNLEYVAVDLNYVKTLEYVGYYYNSYTKTAEEFRLIQEDDEYFSGLMGDGYGDDYEIVDYIGDDFWGDPIFEGIDSGMLYEDEEESFDASMMAGEKENKAFFQKASQVSFAYNVDLKTSMALVTLGKKIECMLYKTNGELTAEDQQALMGDIEGVTGVGLADIAMASTDPEKKEDMIEKIANKIGTSADNLENRLLPELFGVEL